MGEKYGRQRERGILARAICDRPPPFYILNLLADMAMLRHIDNAEPIPLKAAGVGSAKYEGRLMAALIF